MMSPLMRVCNGLARPASSPSCLGTAGQRDIVQTLDCAQRAQTSAKASNLNRKWSGIRIRISGLIRIRIRMSVGSLPCCGYLVGVSHFAECRENRPVTVWEIMIKLQTPILQWVRKVESDPASVSGIRSPPKVNQFFRLVAYIVKCWFSSFVFNCAACFKKWIICVWSVYNRPNYNTMFQRKLRNRLITFAVILHTFMTREQKADKPTSSSSSSSSSSSLCLTWPK